MKTEKHSPSACDRRIINIILIVILILATMVSIWAWLNRCQHIAPPEYNIPDIEINAEEIYGKQETLTDMENEVTVTYSSNAVISISEKTLKFNYGNPSNSTHGVRLTVTVNEQVIAESGLIPPGYHIDHLSDLDTAPLQLGFANGKLIIDAYNMDTGERAITQSVGELSLQIVE